MDQLTGMLLRMIIAEAASQMKTLGMHYADAF